MKLKQKKPKTIKRKLTEVLLRNLLKKHILLILALLYFLSPIDLVPDVIPGTGFLDDVLVVLGSLAFELLQILIEKWRGKRSKKDRNDDENIVEGEIVE